MLSIMRVPVPRRYLSEQFGVCCIAGEGAEPGDVRPRVQLRPAGSTTKAARQDGAWEGLHSRVGEPLTALEPPAAG